MQVDALEKQAKDVLHEVISLRNALRPVNHLHPEVIALCATFVSDTDPKPIIPLTHVCRYWRRAITSSPRNWASIGSGWKRLVPLCLGRAGTVLLTANITVSDIKGDEYFIQASLPHVSKISHLSLTGCSSIEKVADDLPGFFASPMPNLTSLKLEQIEQPTELFPSNEAPAPPLFQSISELKSLHLTRIPLYPAVYGITSLVELELVGYENPLDFWELVGFLRSNRTLEAVVLDLRLAEITRIVPEQRASLPQLRHLAFTCGSAADSRALLSYLSLRRGVSISIQGSRSNPCAELSSFLPHHSKRIRQLFTPVTAIKYQHSPGWLRVSSGDGELSFRTPKDLSKTYGDLDLFVTGTVREFHQNINHLPARLFERLPALEVFVLSRTHLARGSLSALATEPILCPSLKTIAFFDCTVSEDTVRELEAVLAKRRDSTAARLYRVVIVNGTYALPDLRLINQLRKLVPRVDAGVGDELPDLL